jgi:hypothetical protein
MTSNAASSKAASKSSEAKKATFANPNAGEWSEEDLKQMREEWYYLYEQFQTFKQQNPEKHPLFAKAVSVLRKDQSLDYHRAVYETLNNMSRLITIAKETERGHAKANGMQCEPEDAPPQMREAVQREVITLQIGYTLGAMLKKWPKEGEPTVKNTPASKTANYGDDHQQETYNSDDDAPQ